MNNYSKMYQSENAETSIPEENQATTADVVEVWQMSISDTMTPDPESTATTAASEPEIPEAEEPVIGVVVNCTKLNVRQEPITTATVICTLVALDEVMIDEEASTDEFYKICTVSGIEGYCMKKYIVIREE